MADPATTLSQFHVPGSDPDAIGVAENARLPLKLALVSRANSHARVSHALAPIGARLPKSCREPGPALPAGSRDRNIPRMFAAWLLLSPAGIGIYMPLALASHPA